MERGNIRQILYNMYVNMRVQACSTVISYRHTLYSLIFKLKDSKDSKDSDLLNAFAKKQTKHFVSGKP